MNSERARVKARGPFSLLFRPARSWRWWLAAVAVAALLVAWLTTGRMRTALVPGGYFAGEIAGVGPVFLSFTELNGEVAGSVVRGEGGKAEELRGVVTEGNHFQLTIAHWINEVWNTNVTLNVSVDAEARECEGQWKDEIRGEGRSFRLKKIAVAGAVQSSFSMRLGERGHRREFDCPVPWLDEHLSLFQPQILHQIDRLEREFMDGCLEQLWTGIQWPSAANEWKFTAICEPRRMDSSVCSLAWSTFPEIGGNGNWQRYRTINLWNSNGVVRAFQLRDLFKPDSGWELRLGRICATRLRELGASDYGDPERELVENVPKLFTVSKTGVQIYFDPYTAGSGAEGAFVVDVPFANFAGLLSANGPMR